MSVETFAWDADLFVLEGLGAIFSPESLYEAEEKT